MIESEFIIREPKISWLNRIIFSLVFSLLFALIIYWYRSNIINKLTTVDIIYAGIYYIIVIVSLFGALVPLVKRDYTHFNFTQKKIKHSYNIGVYDYDGQWQDLVDLKYISVFNTNNGYAVNLWYEKNKIIHLFILENPEEVIEKGLFFAEKLNIGLVDARKRGYHKRVNMEVYKDTGNIIYI